MSIKKRPSLQRSFSQKLATLSLAGDNVTKKGGLESAAYDNKHIFILLFKKELISIFYNIEGDFEKSELIDKIGEKLAE